MIRLLFSRSFIAIAIAFFIGHPAHAVFINVDYGSFTGDDLTVLKDAVKEWQDLLPCRDGMTNNIQFFCDNTLPIDVLGRTTVNYRDGGWVDSASIILHNDALYFTMTPPAQWDAGHSSAIDALTVAKHELGHALGFDLSDSARVKRHIRSVNGVDFYDMNNNDTFDASDFRFDMELHGPGIPQLHAYSDSDVMYWSIPSHTRRVPTVTDAGVLVNAYGYCPEPSTLQLSVIGLAAVIISRRFRRINGSS